MTAHTIEQEVYQIISEHLGKPINEIKSESILVDDLDADSLDCMEIMYISEEKFGIEISDAQIEEVSTVQELIDLIKRSKMD